MLSVSKVYNQQLHIRLKTSLVEQRNSVVSLQGLVEALISFNKIEFLAATILRVSNKLCLVQKL